MLLVRQQMKGFWMPAVIMYLWMAYAVWGPVRPCILYASRISLYMGTPSDPILILSLTHSKP